MKLYGRLHQLKQSDVIKELQKNLSKEDFHRLETLIWELAEVFYNRGWDDRDERTTDFVVKGLRRRNFNVFKGEIEDG